MLLGQPAGVRACVRGRTAPGCGAAPLAASFTLNAWRPVMRDAARHAPCSPHLHAC
ncbi:hypothetical protein FA09DRAFT_327996 [Tilletiopsis washingtonensis]|uniref:Uncharacterized protein n=1 Tax=Tilletiopsis washingtonensis TaxID=58919 RepID=A0A316ZGE5_9BASI|nr:hypothetical protein FA09DRAFT_327996 [Tilletiopsis washingtonensis]PWO00582.1 hypothetical protein FA09DRAFT_327996 [Tilletiopsis washingtonensis]